jgi:putative MFS transporter
MKRYGLIIFQGGFKGFFQRKFRLTPFPFQSIPSGLSNSGCFYSLGFLRFAKSVKKQSLINRHSVAFWFGTLYILIGFGLHLPDLISRSDVHFSMNGLPMSHLMHFGMFLILGGIALTAYGLFPVHTREVHDASGEFELHSMDSARLSPRHWQLVAVLGIALVVDVMKPATLGFVVPGMRHEYGLTARQAALLPLCAMIGTTIGSIIWGVLADRMGRRGSILLASMIFIATGICGCMPAFKWNLLMCLFMGMSAGGMLPIVFALLAEMVPSRHRGWLSVLVGGLGSAGGYLAASGAAAWLEPLYSWRVLWLLNVPTGFLVILLSRFIPESPRFLLHEGRVEDARRTLATFNIELVPAVNAVRERVKHSSRQLFRAPYAVITFTVCAYGVAWGLVNWGFLTWLPTILQDYLQLDGRIANRLLAKAALFAIPGCLLVAWLYGFWSSKKTMILFATGTAAVLGGFASFKAGDSQVWFSVLTVFLLVGLSGMIAMLSPYSVELYPTKLRATGGGVVASSSKAGGIIGPSSVAFILTAFPGLTVPALTLAVPLLIAAITLGINGRETSGRRLEEIHEVPPVPEPTPR